MLGVLIGVLSVALLAAHMALAHAQAQVSLAAPPATQGTGLGDLLADPGKWATTMFNAALIGLDENPPATSSASWAGCWATAT
jgi:hypothetical protein